MSKPVGLRGAKYGVYPATRIARPGAAITPNARSENRFVIQLTVNVPGEVALPPLVTIMILPVLAPVGTVAVTWVLEFTVKLAALTPPKLTLVVCVRLMPVITTCVPTGPLVGANVEIEGMTLNTCGVTRLPPGSSTVTVPVVAPAATVAVM